MRIIGCDLHPRQQTLAMLDTTTGEVVKTTHSAECSPNLHERSRPQTNSESCKPSRPQKENFW
jgi:hypothetical protein